MKKWQIGKVIIGSVLLVFSMFLLSGNFLYAAYTDTFSRTITLATEINTEVTILTQNLQIVGIGEQYTLDIELSDGTDNEHNLIWTSNDETIATVDENGVVTSTGYGTCTITVLTPDGTEASTKVTVVEPVTGITLSSGSGSTVERGQTAQVTATVEAMEGVSQDVTWTTNSTNPETSISSEGVLTVAINEELQELIVTATSVADPTKCASTTLGVLDPVKVAQTEVTGVTISSQSEAVVRGQDLKLTASVEGTEGISQEVMWTTNSTNPETSISEEGVLTVAADETLQELVVTATSVANPTMNASTTISVTDSTVTRVTINSESESVGRGEKLQLTATVEGSEGISQQVMWTTDSTNPETSISEEGVLTVAEDEENRELVITATSVADETQSATVTLSVVEDVFHVEPHLALLETRRLFGYDFVFNTDYEKFRNT